MDKYAVTVHGIKGSCRGIIAKRAGDEAEALEKAAIAGNYDFVIAHNQRFIDYMVQLLTDIGDAIYKSGKTNKPIKDKPEVQLLKKLLSACESFDIDQIDEVMAEIEYYTYDQDDGLALWLRDNIDQGKYKAIINRLLSSGDNKEV